VDKLGHDDIPTQTLPPINSDARYQLTKLEEARFVLLQLLALLISRPDWLPFRDAAAPLPDKRQNAAKSAESACYS
jgi:hypothetical protein